MLSMQETEDVHPSSAATKTNSNTCHSNEEREKGESEHSQQMQTPKMILTERLGKRLSEAYPLN